jgi:hypothetical protein
MIFGVLMFIAILFGVVVLQKTQQEEAWEEF